MLDILVGWKILAGVVQHHYIAINFVLANADPSGHTENGSVTENKENIEITEETNWLQT